MQTIANLAELKSLIRIFKQERKTIGLVPTMGYLHDGHLSLLRQARKDNDIVVLSIFVNPLQFGLGEDYETYPRDLSHDQKLAASVGTDLIFAPSAAEMYPKGYATFVEVERLSDKLCGLSRPGHFRGVATVVTKLFNLVGPTRAYFGQKDAQQLIIIQQMVRDLNMDVEIIGMPTIREKDGLAMSSRNVYLNPAERQAATILFRSLQQAEQMVYSGEHSAEKIRQYLYRKISSEPLAKIDYISVADAATLEKLETVKGKILIALAVKFGKTRLIDNIIIGTKEEGR